MRSRSDAPPPPNMGSGLTGPYSAMLSATPEGPDGGLDDDDFLPPDTDESLVLAYHGDAVSFGSAGSPIIRAGSPVLGAGLRGEGSPIPPDSPSPASTSVPAPRLPPPIDVSAQPAVGQGRPRSALRSPSSGFAVMPAALPSSSSTGLASPDFQEPRFAPTTLAQGDPAVPDERGVHFALGRQVRTMLLLSRAVWQHRGTNGMIMGRRPLPPPCRGRSCFPCVSCKTSTWRQRPCSSRSWRYVLAVAALAVVWKCASRRVAMTRPCARI